VSFSLRVICEIQETNVLLHGHCECERVSFIVDGNIEQLSHCHCSQCRRLHGAAYGSYARVAKQKFQYLTGANELKNYASSEGSTRVFCTHCGSNIMVIVADEPKELFLAMGVIDGDPILPDDCHHIFVDSKAPWHNITDDLPQYDEFVPEIES